MSDISKKIFSIDPDPDEEPVTPRVGSDKDDGLIIPDPDGSGDAATPDLRNVVDMPDIIFRPARDLESPAIEDKETQLPDKATTPEPDTSVTAETASTAPEPSPIPSRIVSDETAIQTGTTKTIGWFGVLMGLFTALAVSGLLYVLIGSMNELSAVGLSAVILAILVSTVSMVALVSVLRTLSLVRERSDKLTVLADRLIRPDDTIAKDMSRMASAIRRELAQVDSQLAQSREELDTLVAQTTRQSLDLEKISRTMMERTETTARAMRDHREAFATLTDTIDNRITALGETAGEAKADLDEAVESLNQTRADMAETSQTSEAKIIEAENRLSEASRTLAETGEKLDRIYADRSEQLNTLTASLSSDDDSLSQALTKQSDRFGSINETIAATEERLSKLLDQAQTMQDQLSARLSDIDASLAEADQRAKSFTADLADRVGDAVSETRRELSVMEGELRALKSRMEGVETGLLPLEGGKVEPEGRLQLRPLDTDFPSLDADDIEIPDEPDTPPTQTLDLMPVPTTADPTTVEQPMAPAADVVRRPGHVGPSGSVFGRARETEPKAGWRWRDMLGTIDPIDEVSPQPETMSDTIPDRSGIERPPPGVPLQPPATHRAEPDGSDIVARLCEVGLPPSSTVDAPLIDEALSSRRLGGEVAQARAVNARLPGQTEHLRHILGGDLEFRLRAESYRRGFDVHLAGITDDHQLRAELASANGRAYLLCAAAMISA